MLDTCLHLSSANMCEYGVNFVSFYRPNHCKMWTILYNHQEKSYVITIIEPLNTTTPAARHINPDIIVADLHYI